MAADVWQALVPPQRKVVLYKYKTATADLLKNASYLACLVSKCWDSDLGSPSQVELLIYLFLAINSENTEASGSLCQTGK